MKVPDVYEISKITRNLAVYSYENKTRRLLEDKIKVIDNKEFVSIVDLKEILRVVRNEILSDNLVKRNE